MKKRVVADESVDFGLIVKLREAEFEVISISEKFAGIDNPKVLEIAVKEHVILITEDKDFGELTFRLKKNHYGILLIRLSDVPRKERLIVATKFIQDYYSALQNHFSVLTKNGLRIKKTSR